MQLHHPKGPRQASEGHLIQAEGGAVPSEEAQAQRIPGEQKDKRDPHHRSHASKEANRHPGLSEVG